MSVLSSIQPGKLICVAGTTMLRAHGSCRTRHLIPEHLLSFFKQLSRTGKGTTNLPTFPDTFLLSTSEPVATSQ